MTFSSNLTRRCLTPIFAIIYQFKCEVESKNLRQLRGKVNCKPFEPVIARQLLVGLHQHRVRRILNKYFSIIIETVNYFCVTDQDWSNDKCFVRHGINWAASIGDCLDPVQLESVNTVPVSNLLLRIVFDKWKDETTRTNPDNWSSIRSMENCLRSPRESNLIGPVNPTNSTIYV